MSDLEHDNKLLRLALVEVTQEKLRLEEALARENLARIQIEQAYVQLRRDTGFAPHDFEPARPGLSEVD